MSDASEAGPSEYIGVEPVSPILTARVELEGTGDRVGFDPESLSDQAGDEAVMTQRVDAMRVRQARQHDADQANDV